MRMEIEKLILTDVKLPRLTNIDETHRSSFKPLYHDHLMKFQIDDARAVQIHAYLTDMALCMKTTSFVALRPSKRYVVMPRPKRFYYDAMLLHVPVAPPLHVTTYHKIHSVLPRDKVAAFKDMVKLTADEVIVLYDSVSHRLASHELLKERPHDGRISLYHDLKSSSIPSLTFHQLPNFVGRQLQLESKLLLLHPMMIQVLDSTFTNIPEIIMDFGVYRKLQKDYHDIQKLQELMVKDLRRAENLVTRIWYPKVIKMLSKKGALGKLSRENLSKFLKCATTIISCQVITYNFRVYQLGAIFVEGDDHMSSIFVREN
ncbi:uncharacterized protein LOC120355007 [Nilaparvata lugens]|uniref:uncharacterized protein LOC120355007 n=1 Tax=Nilaparvata lugens TaxID=108931 RepID=UPI00193D3F46|nr:uncharacterized protein LOC120355007 [Nilaparvata lugens]